LVLIIKSQIFLDFQEVISPNFSQNFSVQRSEIDSLVFKCWIWKPSNKILFTHAEIFCCCALWDQVQTFFLMSQFKVFAWFVIALPTAVLAAAVAFSKTLVAEA